jgi:hypothetical protein
MVTRQSTWILLGASLVACHQTIDPCPRGYRASRDRDHCVVGDLLDASAEPVVEASPDDLEGAEPDLPDADAGGSVEEDANTLASGTMDGAAETGAQDDAASEVLDATLDTDSVAASDATSAPDTSLADAATICAPSGVEAWRAAHLKSDIRDRITQCRANCDNDVTCVDLCLRRPTGIQDCEACTHAETACSSDWCGYACLPSRTDRACLACLCQADCVRTFESCADRDLGFCGPELFTFGASPAGPALDSTAVLLAKSTTGGLAMTKFDLATQLFADHFPLINHFPNGHAKLISLSLPALELVLHYGASCAQPPCTVRGYPMLRDGSFGTPVFEERWETDYVDVEAFSLAGESYLVRLSDQSSARPSVDNLSIDRVTWNSERNLAVSTPALRTGILSPTSRHYTQIEPFTLGGELFFFLLSPESGEALVMHLQATPTGLDLGAASDAIHWSLGWDRLEAFKSFGHWYLFTYKSGRVAVDQEPAGQTRIWQPRLDTQGRVVLDQPVFDALRGAGDSHALSFSDGSGRARVLLYQELLGRLSTYLLDADPAQWPENFSIAQQVQQRGRTPPWDVLGLVKEGKW